jgi:hypothetical protein
MTGRQSHGALSWQSAFLLPSSIGQDATLSRWRERFDSARERQQNQLLSLPSYRSVQHLSNKQRWTEEDNYGYVPAPSETLIRSDEVASILVYRDGRPIKIIRPNGRVELFVAPDTRH